MLVSGRSDSTGSSDPLCWCVGKVTWLTRPYTVKRLLEVQVLHYHHMGTPVTQEYGVQILHQKVQRGGFLSGGVVHDTQEEAAAVCQYHFEDEHLRQMRQYYPKLLRMEAILKTDSHTSCPVLRVFPHPVGIAGNLAKRQLHLSVKPCLRHGDNVSLVTQHKVVNADPPHIGRHHSQVCPAVGNDVVAGLEAWSTAPTPAEPCPPL